MVHIQPGYLLQGTVKDGIRQSTNVFLKTVHRHRKNLHIVPGIRVTKLNIDDTKRVTGVEYVLDRDRAQRGKVFANKEVILSVGALASPQILMLSGIGPQETLNSLGINVIKNSKVGYNLMNHPTSTGVTVILTRSSNVPRSKEEWLSDIRQYDKTHDGPLSATGISQLSGYIPSSDATDDYPDLKFGFAFSDVNSESADIPASYYSKITVLPYHVRPKSRGFFTINSTDPFDPPLVYPNLLGNPEDRKPLIEGHLFALKLANTKAFKESGFVLDTTKIHGCEPEMFGTYEYFNCAVGKYVGAAHHIVLVGWETAVTHRRWWTRN